MKIIYASVLIRISKKEILIRVRGRDEREREGFMVEDNIKFMFYHAAINQ
jgi:hypothetical protein